MVGGLGWRGFLALGLSGLAFACFGMGLKADGIDVERLQGRPFAVALDCRQPPQPGDQQLRIDAPEAGWPAWSQSVLVLDAPPGRVSFRRGDDVRCGMSFDARSTDARFRSGVGVTLAPAQGSREPILVTAPSGTDLGWGITVRYGDPAPVQREDTLRFAIRVGGLAVLIAMLMSSLLIFANARDRVAGLFAVAIAAFGLWIALRSGIAAWPRPWLPNLTLMGLALQWLPAFVIAAHWYLTLVYPRADRELPWLYARRHLGFGVGALLALLWWLLPEARVDLFGLWRAFALAILIASTLAMLVLWRRGQPGAKALLVAFLPLLLVLGPLYAETLRAWRSESLLLMGAWYAVTMNIAMSLRMGALRRQRDRLQLLAERDPLTHLPNRRATFATLPRRIDEARAQGKPLAVVFLDLDHFKRVNDTHGHAVGDEVLVETARRLSAQLRGGDLVARHGGEEFLVVLPGSDVVQATALAERLRESLRASPVSTRAGPLAITASLGVALLREADPRGMAGAEALVARADAAMYRAKQSGRDRVEGEAPEASSAPA